MLLENFSDKLVKENISKLTNGKEILNDISNDYGAEVVNFTSSKVARLKVQSSHILTRIIIVGSLLKTRSQIDYILISRERHSSELDVLSLRQQMVILTNI
jgi:hypothetical protein